MSQRRKGNVELNWDFCLHRGNNYLLFHIKDVTLTVYLLLIYCYKPRRIVQIH